MKPVTNTIVSNDMTNISVIIPETFVNIGVLILRESKVSVRLGDVTQNDVMHSKAAMTITVTFKSEDTKFYKLFKGHDMVRKACEWLFTVTKGEFTYNDVGPIWLTKRLQEVSL